MQNNRISFDIRDLIKDGVATDAYEYPITNSRIKNTINMQLHPMRVSTILYHPHQNIYKITNPDHEGYQNELKQLFLEGYEIVLEKCRVTDSSVAKRPDRMSEVRIALELTKIETIAFDLSLNNF